MAKLALLGPKHALLSSQKTENRLNNMLYTPASIKVESLSRVLIEAFDDKFNSYGNLLHYVARCCLYVFNVF